MPNNTRIPLCPYYKDEKNKSISCEDVFRRFATLKKKYAHMDTYCCKDWQSCEYAAELNAMYERIEKGADMDLEQTKQKLAAAQKELRYNATLLGRADRRIEAKEAEIKDLRRKNRELEEKRLEEFKKRRKAEITLNDYEKKAYGQLEEIIKTYKDALCYLLSMRPDQELPEAEIKEWTKDKAYTIMRTYKDDKDMTWKLVEFDAEEGKEDVSEAEE